MQLTQSIKRQEKCMFVIIVENISLLLSVIDRPSTQKTNKEIDNLKTHINQLDLRVIEYST